MKPPVQIKPISHLKAHTSEVVRRLTEEREPLIITQNGEAKVVMQVVKYFEETQKTLALLKIMALENRQIEKDEIIPAKGVFARLRNRKPT